MCFPTASSADTAAAVVNNANVAITSSDHPLRKEPPSRLRRRSRSLLCHKRSQSTTTSSLLLLQPCNNKGSGHGHKRSKSELDHHGGAATIFSEDHCSCLFTTEQVVTVTPPQTASKRARLLRDWNPISPPKLLPRGRRVSLGLAKNGTSTSNGSTASAFPEHLMLPLLDEKEGSRSEQEGDEDEDAEVASLTQTEQSRWQLQPRFSCTFSSSSSSPSFLLPTSRQQQPLPSLPTLC